MSCVVYAAVHNDDVKLSVSVRNVLIIEPLGGIVSCKIACLCTADGCIGCLKTGNSLDSALYLGGNVNPITRSRVPLDGDQSFWYPYGKDWIDTW